METSVKTQYLVVYMQRVCNEHQMKRRVHTDAKLGGGSEAPGT